MAESSLPSFSVNIPPADAAQVVVAGIYAPHLALSRPVPHYKVQGQLQMRMGVSKSHEALEEEHHHLVKLTVAAELVQGDDVLALRAEVALEAIVVAVGLDDKALAYQLERELPARLFAHARVHIETLTRDSGYMPITLPPVPLDPADQPGAAS